MNSCNKVKVSFQALPENQSFARAVAAAYIVNLDPTVEELTEVKTAVSEAVSNAIIHGYGNKGVGAINMELSMLTEYKLQIKVEDFGVGISDVAQAMQPLFTTSDTPELSGMGFTVMESFTDRITVNSKPGMGTTVILVKNLETYYGK